jgi:hypothetical protein
MFTHLHYIILYVLWMYMPVTELPVLDAEQNIDGRARNQAEHTRQRVSVSA